MFNSWQCGRFTLDLSETKIMGVLNRTPDSFSDGGKFFAIDDALKHAEALISEGADILDIGAESTRPGSASVPPEEEIKRLTPLVKTLVAEAKIPLSIDTKNARTMQAMLDLGVDMINDVHGLEDKDALQVVASSDNCGVCLMHMRGMPENMQNDTQYADVVAEVDSYLRERAALCEAASISPNRVMLDPGFGFGKTPEQNMALIRHGAKYASRRYPVLIGVSRKSTIGYYLGKRSLDGRMVGSVTLAALGAWLGAHVVRVHDVAATRDALQMVKALKLVEGE